MLYLVLYSDDTESFIQAENEQETLRIASAWNQGIEFIFEEIGSYPRHSYKVKTRNLISTNWYGETSDYELITDAIA